MVIFHSYVKLQEGKSPFSYGFPMGFPMVFPFSYGLPEATLQALVNVPFWGIPMPRCLDDHELRPKFFPREKRRNPHQKR